MGKATSPVLSTLLCFSMPAWLGMRSPMLSPTRELFVNVGVAVRHDLVGGGPPTTASLYETGSRSHPPPTRNIARKLR